MQDAFSNNPLFDPNKLLGNITASDDCKELMVLFGQLYAAFMNSGLRYWSSLAELYGNNAGALSSDLAELYNNPDLSAAERKRRIEKLRAWLRQTAELIERESRLLQNQFSDIDNKLRQLNGDEQTDEPKRYARSKS